jgi:predicted Fe-Mo cluster-binding NifX family protein
MKIAVSATGEKLDGYIDRRFERCPYFLIVDTDTMNYNSIFNNGTMKKDGSSSTALDIVLDNNVDALITGDIRQGAYKKLSDANIKIITGLNGIIRTTIDEFKLNEIKHCPSCNSTNLERDYTNMEFLCKDCELKKKV